MRRRTVWAVLAVLAGLALAAGCSSSSGDDAADQADSVGDDIGAGGEGGGGGGDETAAGDDGPLGAQAPPAEDPARIIYTADLRVRVDDPAAAARQAVALVEEAGGSLASQTEVEGEDRVTVTVRVPVGGFGSAVDALAELGTVLDRHVEAQDVTDQVVDLEGRLENARASADRLRELYATAGDVGQIVTIEQALTEREAEVESLAGQLQQLEDRADRSTITATFVDEGEPTVDEDDDANAFVQGVRAGRDLLLGLGTVLAALAGFLVPFSPLVLLGVVAALVTTRRARRRSSSPPATAPAPSTSGPGPEDQSGPMPPS